MHGNNGDETILSHRMIDDGDGYVDYDEEETLLRTIMFEELFLDVKCDTTASGSKVFS